MKRVLLTGAAFAAMMTGSLAADMPSYPVEAAVVAPADIWAGWFVGVAAGGHFSKADMTVGAATSLVEETTYDDSWIAGIYYGRNWQSGNWVFGLDSSINYWDHSEDLFNSVDGRPTGAVQSADYQTDFLGLSRLKVGYAFDNVLLYAAGGLSSTRIEVGLGAGDDAIDGTEKKWAFGYNIGAGVDFMFADNWSARLEYIYVNIEKDGFEVGATPLEADIDISSSIIRGGVAYHF